MNREKLSHLDVLKAKVFHSKERFAYSTGDMGRYFGLKRIGFETSRLV
jgi:hypothetical protein